MEAGKAIIATALKEYGLNETQISNVLELVGMYGSIKKMEGLIDSFPNSTTYPTPDILGERTEMNPNLNTN